MGRQNGMALGAGHARGPAGGVVLVASHTSAESDGTGGLPVLGDPFRGGMRPHGVAGFAAYTRQPTIQLNTMTLCSALARAVFGYEYAVLIG